ncbi:MAG: caspase family protein [Myxococcales bacterium]|nr:caspase family protein [Myxococcales bacterium]
MGCAALLFAGAARAHVDGACGTPAEPAAPPSTVFTLLIGYPYAPPTLDLAPLTAVGDDVARMHAFFAGLSPAASYVHLDAESADPSAFGAAPVRAPTFAAVLKSVEALEAQIEKTPGAVDVYVYYAGHGQRWRPSEFTRTRIFLQPDKRSGPGHDGQIDSALLDEAVLAPLSKRATVHLIVDACQSFFLLETREAVESPGIARLPPPTGDGVVRRFIERLPRVGAVLATNGSQSTFEDPSLGGVFSYALRTAATGHGDRNHDGVITYGELEETLRTLLRRRNGSGRPGVLAPTGRAKEAFIDWRGRKGTARVCFAPPVPVRYELLDSRLLPYAVLHPSAGEPVTAFVPTARTFYAMERAAPLSPARWWKFNAGDGAFDALRRTPESDTPPRIRGPGDAMLAEPFPRTLAQASAGPDWGWTPRGYLTIAAQGRAALFPTTTAAGGEQGFGGALAVGYGRGAHQLSGRLQWQRWSGDGRYRSEASSQVFADVQLFSMTLDYGLTLVDGPLQWAVGGYGGGGVLLEDPRTEERTEVEAVAVVEGGLSTMARVPFGRWALRGDLRAGGLGFDSRDHGFQVDPTFELALGVEVELPVD